MYDLLYVAVLINMFSAFPHTQMKRMGALKQECYMKSHFLNSIYIITFTCFGTVYLFHQSECAHESVIGLFGWPCFVHTAMWFLKRFFHNGNNRSHFSFFVVRRRLYLHKQSPGTAGNCITYREYSVTRYQADLHWVTYTHVQRQLWIQFSTRSVCHIEPLVCDECTIHQDIAHPPKSQRVFTDAMHGFVKHSIF